MLSNWLKIEMKYRQDLIVTATTHALKSNADAAGIRSPLDCGFHYENPTVPRFVPL